MLTELAHRINGYIKGYGQAWSYKTIHSIGKVSITAAKQTTIGRRKAQN